MNKVLLIVGEATETVDTLYPYYRLQEDGFEPVVAGPERRRTGSKPSSCNRSRSWRGRSDAGITWFSTRFHPTGTAR